MATEMKDHVSKPHHAEEAEITDKPFPTGCLIFLVVFFFLVGLGMGEAIFNG